MADGDPESAELALVSARQMRCLSYNHAAAAAYREKPEFDLEQLVALDDESE